MKQTYRIDPQGRIMIPVHIRKQLNLKPGSTVNIDRDGRNIRIKLAQENCVICGKPVKASHAKTIQTADGEKVICDSCSKSITEKGEQHGND